MSKYNTWKRWCTCGYPIILIRNRVGMELTFLVLDGETEEILDRCSHCHLKFEVDGAKSLAQFRIKPADFNGEDRI